MRQFIMGTLLFALLPFYALAQSPENATYSHHTYDWAKDPVLHSAETAKQTTAAIIIKDKRIIEYAYGDDGLYCYKTIHRIVRVNDDAAVENFNKVFVPMNEVVDFVELKARAITPDGKVISLNRDNIKELENVGDMGGFKIFAIEGVEKGGEVEYFYTTLSEAGDLQGSEIIQNDTPIQTASLDIISPYNLLFAAKSYNGFPQLAESLSPDSLNVLSATLDNIEPLLEEQYANYRANLMQVNYKMAKNRKMPDFPQLHTWNKAALTFSGLTYQYDKTAQKSIAKLLKNLKISRLKSDFEKVKAIENYLKNNIAIEQAGGAELYDVAQILNNKYASEMGMARVYAALFQEANIPSEVVITCERTRATFDRDFESWHSLTDILFYLPQLKGYLSPDLRHLRCGMPAYQYGGNYGLFITPNGKHRLQKIEFPPAKDNMNLIDATVHIPDNFEATMSMTQSWTGYRAAEFRAIYEFQKDDFMKDRLKSEVEDAEVLSLQLKNEKISDSANPLLSLSASGEVKAHALIEKAGNSYLFKIGEIIGTQVEMYQNHERQQPIEMPYPIFYRRIIKFTIPEGYELKGAEDIKIDKSVVENGKIVNRFLSNYTMKGREVTVAADEYYEVVSLPKEQYESFRSVINAAADFNKVVLVFEKAQ